MNLLTLQQTTSDAMARNLTSYGSDDGALSSFYAAMRASINDTNIKSITCMLISDVGNVARSERWVREDSPEPELETTA